MTELNRFKNNIELCWECRTTCIDTLFNYCLEMSGPHAAPDHIKIMLDCIDICQLSADMMRRQSEWHGPVCAACADICDACAESCASMDDDRMQACADLCRRCAASCREMDAVIPATLKEIGAGLEGNA